VCDACAGKPIAYKIGSSFPGDDLDEMWRQVYLDVTSVSAEEIGSDKFVKSLSSWLVHHQPISLAVNCADFDASFALARKLFERTGLVVYTVGSADKPALTAQVRVF
jgi:Na+-transporting NADH:ubiquinone oxidoreductase subunit NqrE